jgi:thioredoxin-related protein
LIATTCHPVRRCHLTTLATLLLVAVTAWGETRDPEKFFFDTGFGDFSEELARAREEGKKGIMIMFEQDDCPFCQRMKATVLNQSEIQDYYRTNFLVFPVDIEGDLEVTDFAGKRTTQKDLALQEYRVRATPVFAFFDLDGKLVARYTGATKNAEEFRLLGQYVADGANASTNFPTYRREHQKGAAKP